MQNHYHRMGEEHKFLSMASPPPPKATTLHHPKPLPFNCPRCHSSNTKFCYYNNYSLSQPRYFCKACKRYWTHGGTLRNVPVGGGCRKNKRLRRPPPTPPPSSTPAHDHAASTRLTALLHGAADFAPPDVSLPFPGFVDTHTPPGYGLHLPQFSFGFPAAQISDPVFAAPGGLGSSSASSGLLDHLGSAVAQQQRWVNGFRDAGVPYRGKKPSQVVEEGNLSKTCLNDGLIRELDSSQNWASWSSDLTSMGSSLTSHF